MLRSEASYVAGLVSLSPRVVQLTVCVIGSLKAVKASLLWGLGCLLESESVLCGLRLASAQMAGHEISALTWKSPAHALSKTLECAEITTRCTSHLLSPQTRKKSQRLVSSLNRDQADFSALMDAMVGVCVCFDGRRKMIRGGWRTLFARSFDASEKAKPSRDLHVITQDRMTGSQLYHTKLLAHILPCLDGRSRITICEVNPKEHNQSAQIPFEWQVSTRLLVFSRIHDHAAHWGTT